MAESRDVGEVEKRLKALSTEQVSDILLKKEGEVYADDVEALEIGNEQLEAEIKRLSLQVMEVSAERDAFQKHSQWLGSTLKRVREVAAQKHMGAEDLGGVDLQDSFAMEEKHGKRGGEGEGGEGEGEGEEGGSERFLPQLAALELRARECGWLVAADELSLGKKIGSGATADIYLATWHGLDVAVKCLRPSYFKSDPAGLKSFIQEAELLSRQRHPFVIRLLGASLCYPDKCWIVTELLPNATLTEWLHGDKSRSWQRKTPLPPLKERIRMALEVSQAMQHLHEQSPMVVHRDLKPSNVFLDGSFHVRVADFGSARFLEGKEAAMTGETGTYMYMAPEVVKHEHYSEKCDIYSYGIMLCELMTGNPPYIETFLTPMQMAVGVADGSLRPKLPHGMSPNLVSLISSSWAQDPSKRPSFSGITMLLKQMYEEMAKEGHGHKDHKGGGFFGFMH